jgi:hypothetical protein
MDWVFVPTEKTGDKERISIWKPLGRPRRPKFKEIYFGDESWIKVAVNISSTEHLGAATG